MEKYEKLVPETSWNQYISGWEALNVATTHKDPVDWHIQGFWFSDKTNTMLKTYSRNPYLGTEGIGEDDILFPAKKKVYIANNERAFVDLVYAFLTDENRTDKEKKLLLATLRGDIYNFFPKEQERRYVFCMLKLLQKHLNDEMLEAFMRTEMPKEYYIDKYEGGIPCCL